MEVKQVKTSGSEALVEWIKPAADDSANSVTSGATNGKSPNKPSEAQKKEPEPAKQTLRKKINVE